MLWATAPRIAGRCGRDAHAPRGRVKTTVPTVASPGRIFSVASYNAPRCAAVGCGVAGCGASPRGLEECMASRRQDFALGLVVLIVIALLVGTVTFIYPSLRVQTRTVRAQFRHDQGVAPVQETSPVLLSGALQVGKVSHVELSESDLGPDEGGRQLVIVVTMEIDQDLPLYQDCQIATDQPPVGGAGVVVIRDVGSPEAGLVSPGDTIMGQPSQSLAATIGNLSQRLLGKAGMLDRLEWLVNPEAEGSLVYKLLATMENIEAMSVALRDELSPAEAHSLIAKVHIVLDHFARTTGALAEQMRLGQDPTLMAKVHAAIDRLSEGLNEATGILAENRPALRTTMQNVEQATTRLDAELLGRLAGELDRNDPASLLGRLHASMRGVQTSLDDLNQITAGAEALVATNTPAVDRMMENLKATSVTLKLATDELRAAPWRLLYRPPDDERQQANVFDAARSFAEAAMYLDDAAARLEAMTQHAGATRTPAQTQELRRIREALRDAFGRFEQAERYLWEQMRR